MIVVRDPVGGQTSVGRVSQYDDSTLLWNTRTERGTNYGIMVPGTAPLKGGVFSGTISNRFGMTPLPAWVFV